MAKKKLGEVVIKTAKVSLGDDDYIEVRGISLADITDLFQRHTGPLTKAFDDFMDNRMPGVALDMAYVQGAIQDTLIDAPRLVGDLIATAMDEPENADHAAKLPTGVQIQALFAIAQLSITTEAELKKVIGVVTTLIQSATTLFQTAQEQRKKNSH